MFNAKLEEAKSETPKPHHKSVGKKTNIHIQKPPRSMGVIGIVAALLAFYLGFDEMKLIWECRDWPTVSGIIISSDISQTTEWERYGKKPGSLDRTLYVPNILYNYEVQGNKYQSYKVFLRVPRIIWVVEMHAR